jgi:hypothetical protein
MFFLENSNHFFEDSFFEAIGHSILSTHQDDILLCDCKVLKCKLLGVQPLCKPKDCRY